jgi:branched-subunit amino acid transport protein
VIWLCVLLGSALAFGQKFAGFLVPTGALDRPGVRRAVALMPIALLAALVGVLTFATGTSLQVDARVLGVAAAVIALLLRAPFLVVVVVAAAVTAVVRAVTG